MSTAIEKITSMEKTFTGTNPAPTAVPDDTLSLSNDRKAPVGRTPAHELRPLIVALTCLMQLQTASAQAQTATKGKDTAAKAAAAFRLVLEEEQQRRVLTELEQRVALGYDDRNQLYLVTSTNNVPVIALPLDAKKSAHDTLKYARSLEKQNASGTWNAVRKWANNATPILVSPQDIQKYQFVYLSEELVQASKGIFSPEPPIWYPEEKRPNPNAAISGQDRINRVMIYLGKTEAAMPSNGFLDTVVSRSTAYPQYGMVRIETKPGHAKFITCLNDGTIVQYDDNPRKSLDQKGAEVRQLQNAPLSVANKIIRKNKAEVNQLRIDAAARNAAVIKTNAAKTRTPLGH